jgi:two-component system phosphate regulon sensor histidine kinase PhoR
MLKTFQTRLLLAMMLVPLLACAALWGFALRQTRTEHANLAQSRLLAEARLLAPQAMALMAPKISQMAREAFCSQGQRAGGFRVTLLDAQGHVGADSDVATPDLPKLENHLHRAEVEAAQKQGSGAAVRHSASVGRDLMYVALRLEGAQGQVSGFLRLALPLKDAVELSAATRAGLAWALALSLLAAFSLSWYLARWLARPIQGLTQAAQRLAAGDFKAPLPEEAGVDEVQALQAAFASMARDLSQSFESLRNERLRLKAIFEAMKEAVVVLDAQGRIELANPAANDLLGLHLSHAIGKTWLETLRHSDLAKLLQHSGQGLVQGEVLIAGAAGQADRSLACTIAPITQGGRVVVLSDITELKRLLKMRQEFTANVSHELKTPLTAIMGMAETLLDGALKEPKQARHFVKRIDEQAKNLQALIADTLDLAKVESRGLADNAKPVALGPVARIALKRVEPLARQAGMKITLKAPAKLVVLGHAQGLEQVLGNLLENAVKYASQGKKASLVALALEDGWVEISVQDYGPGISEQAQPRLFERFYRVDASRDRQSGGTGLGLSLVKHLAEAMGGSVGVESRPGEGARFWVKLKKG